MSTSHAVGRKRKAFTPDEDDRLRNLVSRLGDTNWRSIAMKMPRRNRRQCRERWTNYLSPAICNGTWSKRDQDLLRIKVQECGAKWRVIQGFFPGRTDVNIKNHWRQMQRADRKRMGERTLEDPEMGPSFEMVAGVWADDKHDGPSREDAKDSDPSWLFWFD
jgi:hypothetical protein